MNVQEGVTHITKTKDQYELADHEIRLKATSISIGQAKIWANESLIRTTTKEEMSADLLQIFEPESRYFFDILKCRFFSLDDANNIWMMRPIYDVCSSV